MRGGDGVPRATARRRRRFFRDFFLFLRDFLLVFKEFAGLAAMLYHALRQPVGAADRALLHN